MEVLKDIKEEAKKLKKDLKKSIELMDDADVEEVTVISGDETHIIYKTEFDTVYKRMINN